MEPSLLKILLVVVVVVLLFGAGKLPRLMGEVAEGVKAFKKGLREDTPPASLPTADKDKDQDKVA